MSPLSITHESQLSFIYRQVIMIQVTNSVLLLTCIKAVIGPSPGSFILATWSRLVSILVTIIFILILLPLSVLILVFFLVLVMLLVVMFPLLRCRPSLIWPLLLLLGVKVIVRGEAVIQVVVIALV